MNLLRILLHRSIALLRSQSASLILLVFATLCVPATAEQADRILVLKSERKMVLYSGKTVLRTYKVALGSDPTGQKNRQGDHRTPEGRYVIDSRHANSRFYRALHISYPNAEDRAHAAKLGVSPGGDIMIHGLPNRFGWIGSKHLLRDWTDGCIAVTDQEIEEIWKLVPIGTAVEIKP